MTDVNIRRAKELITVRDIASVTPVIVASVEMITYENLFSKKSARNVGSDDVNIRS
jgi:hypothetical protein